MIEQDLPSLLNAMSLDHLRYEKQKRSSELSDLQNQRIRYLYQEGRSNDEWEQDFEESGKRRVSVGHYEAGGFETEDDLSRGRSRLESRIIELKREIEAIEKVIESKVR